MVIELWNRNLSSENLSDRCWFKSNQPLFWNSVEGKRRGEIAIFRTRIFLRWKSRPTKLRIPFDLRSQTWFDSLISNLTKKSLNVILRIAGTSLESKHEQVQRSRVPSNPHVWAIFLFVSTDEYPHFEIHKEDISMSVVINHAHFRSSGTASWALAHSG